LSGTAVGWSRDVDLRADSSQRVCECGLLGRNVGFLTSEQEKLLARSIVLAYDLEVALLDT
jgi:mRNA interferase MazF